MNTKSSQLPSVQATQVKVNQFASELTPNAGVIWDGIWSIAGFVAIVGKVVAASAQSGTQPLPQTPANAILGLVLLAIVALGSTYLSVIVGRLVWWALASIVWIFATLFALVGMMISSGWSLLRFKFPETSFEQAFNKFKFPELRLPRLPWQKKAAVEIQ